MPEEAVETKPEEKQLTNEEEVFGKMFEEFNLTAEEPVVEAKPELVPEPEKEPVKEPVKEEKPPPVAAAPETATKPDATKPSAAKPEAQPAAKPQLTDEQRLEEFKKKREEIIERIIPTYSFTDDQIEMLRNEPEKLLPRLQAENYLNVYEGVVQVFKAQLPGMIQNLQTSRSVEQSSNKDFYKRWPALTKPEHQDTIKRVVTVYRELNPDADLDKIIEETGTMASVQLGLPINGKPPEAKKEVTKEAPKKAPQPANPGATGATTTPANDNPFAELSKQFEFMR